MKYTKLGTAEISELVNELGLFSLPKTTRGIQYRAKEENWTFEEVPSQGGKKGIKRIYDLPNYLKKEIEDRGLEEKVKKIIIKPTNNTTLKPTTPVLALKEPIPSRERSSKLPDFMYEAARGYEEWAENLDKSQIVPVRYYVNVFGSAGSGFIAEDAETEAMWFRESFFQYLQVKPAHCFCTRISGDSMFPTLIDRGTALWKATSQYITEGIYLFRQYEELRIKRLRRVNAHIFNVISDNENKAIYPTEELDLSRLEDYDFEIYGKYLWNCGIAK